MKSLILFVVSLGVLLGSGCASYNAHQGQRFTSAQVAYEMQLRSSLASQPRVELKVPDGTELKGGFSLVVSDPNTPMAPMAVPESDIQTAVKSVMKALPWYWGAIVANNAVQKTSVIQTPPTVVRPEIITVPAEGLAPGGVPPVTP